MSNVLLQAGSALYNYINTNGTVDTYYQKAKQKSQLPYVIVAFVSATDDYTFTDDGINADYSIRVVTKNDFPDEAITLYGQVHELIQDAPLTFDGYSLMRIRRESIYQFQDSQDYWNVGGLYNLDIWKST